MDRSSGKRNDYRILALCWAVYLVAYLCRLNFASALTKISIGIHASEKYIGVIPSVYFIVYASGQMVNGFIGDRVNPYRYILVALTGTAVANLLISFSTQYYQILVLWGANGFFQSMFWGSLLRLLSWNFDPARYKTVATTMSISTICASILSWSVLGTILMEAPWNSYFLIPSLITMVFFTIWLVFTFTHRKPQRPSDIDKPVSLRKSLEILVREKLYYLCCLGFFLGFIKEGLTVWAPTLFMQSLGLDSKHSLILLMSIPIANLLGLFIVRVLLSNNHEDIRKTMLELLIGLGLCSIALFIIGSDVPTLEVLLIALLTALANGAIWIVISYLPLVFSKTGMVSTIVGVFDFSIYMGAAAASTFMGIMLVRYGWTAIPASWAVSALLSCLLCLGGAGVCLRRGHNR
ncbi:MAG: MFS transporter [Sphaerochaetaceae bacterium]